MGERVLVLGGTRSGKSAIAEQLVTDAPDVVYVATGGGSDPELVERVAAHRARRPAGWQTVETVDVPAAIDAAPAEAAVLVDDLAGWLLDRFTAYGLWPEATATVAPLGVAGREAGKRIVAELQRAWTAAADRAGPVVVVADESGLGVTPADPASRRWLDIAGDVVAALSAEADRVLLVVAGRAMELPAHRVPPAVSDEAQNPGLRAHGDTMVPPGALDFAVNVHGDGPPPHIAAAVADATLGRYPDTATARAAIAARHGRDPDEVLPVAGAAEAFWLLATAGLGLRHAAVVHPAFTEPEAALRHAGVPVSRVLRSAEQQWRLEATAVPDDADLVVLGNPNNPTGTLDDPDAIAALCRPGRLVVVDEAFIDFVADEPRWTLAARADLPGLVVVRSVTKLWALPGLRAGYVLAAGDLAARLAAAAQPWRVSAPALAALAACGGDEDYRRRVAAEVAVERETLAAELAALPGVTVAPSAANFLLVGVPDGPMLHHALSAQGIAVRPSTFPGLDVHHLRVRVHDRDANERLVAAMAAELATSSTARSTP